MVFEVVLVVRRVKCRASVIHARDGVCVWHRALPAAVLDYGATKDAWASRGFISRMFACQVLVSHAEEYPLRSGLDQESFYLVPAPCCHRGTARQYVCAEDASQAIVKASPRANGADMRAS